MYLCNNLRLLTFSFPNISCVSTSQFSPGSQEGDRKTAYVGDEDSAKAAKKVATWSVDDVAKLKRLVEQYADGE